MSESISSRQENNELQIIPQKRGQLKSYDMHEEETDFPRGRLCTQTLTESSLHIITRDAIRPFPVSETPIFNDHGSYNLMFSNRGIHKIEGKTMC